MAFRKMSPTFVRDDSGSSLELLGRTGLQVAVDGQIYTIDSEMLVSPMTIAVYRDSISPASDASAGVFEFACAALQWFGFTVESIG